MSLRAKIISIAVVVGLVLFVTYLPWERQSSGLTEVLYSWGEQQEQTSDRLTITAVSGVEGDLVGEHKVDGSNWSIPNILRNLFGG